eukprot:scaffold2169_cov152-Skeletonema_dohrnii-CCMP3373.AAC.2
MALKEVPYVDVFHSRSNPLLSPASFSLPDLAEELSPSGLAVHAILLRINISIAMNASLLCMEYVGSLTFRDSGLTFWDLPVASGSPTYLGSGSYAICSLVFQISSLGKESIS